MATIEGMVSSHERGRLFRPDRSNPSGCRRRRFLPPSSPLPNSHRRRVVAAPCPPRADHRALTCSFEDRRRSVLTAEPDRPRDTPCPPPGRADRQGTRRKPAVEKHIPLPRRPRPPPLTPCPSGMTPLKRQNANVIRTGFASSGPGWPPCNSTGAQSGPLQQSSRTAKQVGASGRIRVDHHQGV